MCKSLASYDALTGLKLSLYPNNLTISPGRQRAQMFPGCSLRLLSAVILVLPPPPAPSWDRSAIALSAVQIPAIRSYFQKVLKCKNTINRNCNHSFVHSFIQRVVICQRKGCNNKAAAAANKQKHLLSQCACVCLCVYVCARLLWCWVR